MPIVGQPTFESGIGNEPTVAELNAWMAVIEDKFDANISTDDIRWPMKAGGPINLNGHGITGIPVLRGQYNLGERRPWVSVRMIFDEVEARGGGTVVLPGNTSQLAATGQDGITGIRIGSNTRFIGHGRSSDCGSLVSVDKENIIVSDLQLSGNNAFYDCDNVTFLRCDFTNVGGEYQLQLQNCRNVNIIDCRFEGATTYQLLVRGLATLRVDGCHFSGWDEYAMALQIIAGGNLDSLTFQYNTAVNDNYGGSHPYAIIFGSTTSTSTLHGKHLLLRGNSFFGTGPTGVYANGIKELMLSANIFFAAAAADKVIEIPNGLYLSLADNLISSAADYGMVLGSTLPGIALHADVIGNLINAADEGLVVFAPRRPFVSSAFLTERLVVHGNYVATADAALPAAAIWRLLDEPTILSMNQIWWGNNFDGVAGYHSYVSSDASDVGGIIGGSASVQTWFQFCANTTPGTTTSGAANEDMVHSTAQKNIVQNNNT